MTQAITINAIDMYEFLTNQGFTVLNLNGVREVVYGRIVGPNLCLRVYSTIECGHSRGVGEDAIRVVLVAKVDGVAKIVGVDKRVHRVVGWKRNLQNRLNSWMEQLGPPCPRCGSFTIKKLAKSYCFWGCCRFPTCRGSVSIQPVTVVQPKSDIYADIIDHD